MTKNKKKMNYVGRLFTEKELLEALDQQRKEIVEEIKKNRPKEKELRQPPDIMNDGTNGLESRFGFNQALKEYDKSVTDTLGEGEK